MTPYEWPANDYAIGSYIQSTISDRYLEELSVYPNDVILDIGCGDGAYSTKLLAKIPQGKLVGIDRSENMLALAKEKTFVYPNFSVQKADVLTMDFKDSFDAIVSFWCLQWCNDIQRAFSNIYRALKPGGQVFTIFPVGDDPYIQSYESVRASQQFASLNHFNSPVDYRGLAAVPAKLAQTEFEDFKVQRLPQSLVLPSDDVFRKFINGIAFYQDQIPADEIKHINEAMVQAYLKKCAADYHGELQFNFSIYLVTGCKRE